MTDPKYEEDAVNLGYLKRALGLTDEQSEELYKYIGRHFGSRPKPPYYKGDTWVDGDKVYTCIQDRLTGLYQDEDWVTESGATEKAERKSKVFLIRPSNYAVGDMWVLQSDNDHKAGKKGEILITTIGRLDYDEDDWVNMLGYGTIRSINEVANNINDALNRLKLNKTSGVVTIYYSDEIPSNASQGDLWYVLDNVSTYVKDNVYTYDENQWKLVTDGLSTVAFSEANEARLIEDGKIQSFYSTTEPTQGMGVGDIWIDTTINKLNRYNGTKWVAVYDTNISEVREDLETITTRVVSVETDLGNVELQVYDSIVDREGNVVDLKGQVQKITTDYVEFTDLKTNSRTEINGSYIKTGTIDASQVNVTNINANNITSGAINASNVAVTNINASNITSGSLSANRISGGTINGNNVTVTNLDADNITSGTLTGRAITNGNNFSVDTSGNMTANSATLTDATITSERSNAKITLDNGVIQTTSANGYRGVDLDGQYLNIYSYNSNNNLIGQIGSLVESLSGYQLLAMIADAGDGLLFGYKKNGSVKNVMRINHSNSETLEIYGDNPIQVHNVLNMNDNYIRNVKIWNSNGQTGSIPAGTSNHLYSLDWTGSQLDFYVDNTNVGTLSDRRLKKEIKDIDEDFLKIIEEVEMKQFKIDNRNGLISFGIIAQDLMEIFEKYNKDPFDYEVVQKIKYKLDDDTIYYKINYEQFLVLKIKAQEEKIKKLDEKYEDLLQRVEKLEGGIK